MKNKLLKIFLLCLLAYGSILGIPMDPKEIEELMAGMNQAKECTFEEEADSGDPDTTDGRKIHHGDYGERLEENQNQMQDLTAEGAEKKGDH